MAKPRSGRHERRRDARRTRDAILDAAEAVFAEHGFDGARTDAIAKASGYNKSLLFLYFGEKLGLYVAVLSRAAQEVRALKTHVTSPVLEDEPRAVQALRFRSYLETVVQRTFDYLANHPRILRMLTWEMAEGWQTYLQVVSQCLPDDTDGCDRLFQRARNANLLRTEFSPVIQMTLVFQVCQSYLAFLPLYQALLPGEEPSGERALAAAREQVVAWVLGAMLVDPWAPTAEHTALEGY